MYLEQHPRHTPSEILRYLYLFQKNALLGSKIEITFVRKMLPNKKGKKVERLFLYAMNTVDKGSISFMITKEAEDDIFEETD